MQKTSVIMFSVLVGFFVILGVYLTLDIPKQITGHAVSEAPPIFLQTSPFIQAPEEDTSQTEEGDATEAVEQTTDDPSRAEDSDVFDDRDDSSDRDETPTYESTVNIEEILRRFGIDIELDRVSAEEVYLAPVVDVETKTYEVPEECKPHYYCTSPANSACVYADANTVLTGSTKPFTEQLCLLTEGAPLGCPSVYRNRVECSTKAVVVEAQTTPSFSPDGKLIETVETNVLDAETRAIVAALFVQKEEGIIKRADVTFANG